MRKQYSSQTEAVFSASGGILSALPLCSMKPKSFLLALSGGLALAFGVAWPSASQGQAEASDRATDALLVEIAAQQALIAQNQTAIDQKIATVAENVRVARIFVSRGGGKAK
jgi:ABC-type arginine transport system ATPase subunit